MGLPNGKTEAWYVLSAAPGAKVAVGLDRRLTQQQLRQAVDDGSISDRVVWRTVFPDDAISVPAGTIHAIGAGLVIAEIQQRSDATFRLFDHGRQRELHIERAIAVADAGPAHCSGATEPAHRRAHASRLRPALRARADRSAAELQLVSRGETGDLASRSERGCRRRIARHCHGRCRLRAVGPRRHMHRQRWHGGPSGVHRHRADSTSAAAPRAGGPDGCKTATGRPGADFSHSSKGGLDEQPPGNNEMKQLQRVAFIGNHLPRRCGIATFTHDLHRAVATARPDLETCVVAMTDPGRTYDYPTAVRFQIRDDVVGDYVETAEFLNNAGFDVACLQHEYGIFGGEAGGNIIELLSRLEMPIVDHPSHRAFSADAQSARSDASNHRCFTKIVVMSEKGHELLRSVHDVPTRKIEVIPHGIPDFPFLETHRAKAKFGFGGKTIILTFGLLSPNKGIEIMLDAMPGIIESCPNAVYVILGATHPNLVRDQGEAYRESLTARVQELGIEDHVVFFDQFVDQATLLDFISTCDVYVTPYLNEAQMTSGTLAYSFGLGKAVVSTPYWHAKELLGDGRGILVPFGDAKALSAEITGLLTNDVRRHSMRKRAYAASRSMTWAQTAKRISRELRDRMRARHTRNGAPD